MKRLTLLAVVLFIFSVIHFGGTTTARTADNDVSETVIITDSDDSLVVEYDIPVDSSVDSLQLELVVDKTSRTVRLRTMCDQFFDHLTCETAIRSLINEVERLCQRGGNFLDDKSGSFYVTYMGEGPVQMKIYDEIDVRSRIFKSVEFAQAGGSMVGYDYVIELHAPRTAEVVDEYVLLE